MNYIGHNDESEFAFKAQFISTFLASWCAKHYDEARANNELYTLEQPPVEHAEVLAETAWSHFVERCL
jgi:hypothetical protein